MPGSADPRASRKVRALLAGPPEVVAPALLGWHLTRTTTAGPHPGTVTVELTEVEAYAGPADPASHAFRGQTARNAVMFGTPGHLYVYLSHGLHHCANVVTGPDGEASAVLLRAGRVVEGVEVARARRALRDGVADRALARGPGCLGQALDLRREDSGADLLGADGLALTPGPTRGRAVGSMVSGPRVGVRLADEVAWRSWVDGDPTVSVYRRHPRAGAAHR